MKKCLFPFACVAAFLMFSCNKEVPAGPVTEGRPVKITVSIGGEFVQTKATSATFSNENEEKVNNVQVYIFNNGDLENYVSVNNSKNVEISATSGERTIWALVNAPEITDVTTVNQLIRKTSDLADNAVNGLVMSGSQTQELVDGANVPVTVKRMVSRVSVLKITPEFTYSREGYVMEIQGIYLINVVGDCYYDGTPVSNGVWYNKLGHVIPDGATEGECDAVLYDAVSATIQNGSPYQIEHVFYPYPNATVSSGSYASTWNPRRTMLVVQVRVVTAGASGTLPAGTIGYYPVELPQLERNKSYIIENIHLTKNPGENPYRPLDDDAVSATIIVDGWVGPVNLGEQYL